MLFSVRSFYPLNNDNAFRITPTPNAITFSNQKNKALGRVLNSRNPHQVKADDAAIALEKAGYQIVRQPGGSHTQFSNGTDTITFVPSNEGHVPANLVKKIRSLFKK